MDCEEGRISAAKLALSIVVGGNALVFVTNSSGRNENEDLGDQILVPA